MIDKRLDLKLVIPLLIGIAAIVGIALFAFNSKSTSKNQVGDDASSPAKTEVQNSTNVADKKNLVVADDSQDLVAVSEVNQAPRSPATTAAVRTEQKTSADKAKRQTAEKLDLQLSLNFQRLLVQSSLDAPKSYYASAEKPNCGSQNAVSWRKVAGGSIGNLKHGSWICVRTRVDSTSPYQYQLMQIDLTKPNIDLEQRLSSIFVSTKPSNVANIDYFQSKIEPSCNGQDNKTWQDLKGEEIKNVQLDNWVCLRAQIRIDSIFGYKLFKANFKTKPAVNLKQAGTRVLAKFSTKPIYNAGWFKAKAQPECSNKNSSAVWEELPEEGISDLKDKDWVCVRGARTAYGYQLLQVDFSKPTINLSQAGNHIAFEFDPDLLKKDPTILQRTHWGKVSSQPDCNRNNKNIVWQKLKEGSFNDLEYGRYWICIHLTNKFGIENYQAFRVDIRKPAPRPALSIEAVQHNQTFHLTFSQKTATDKKYVANSSEVDCAAAAGYTAVPQDDILLNLRLHDWVCIVATFNNKNYYLKKQVLRPPSISTTQYAISPENDVDRANLVATFNPTNVNSRQYAITTANNCDGANWLALPPGLTFTANETVCLRARDNQGVWSNSAYQYIAQAAPTYSNILARKVTVSWPTANQKHYFVSPHKPRECDQSRSNNWTLATGNTTTISLAHNGDWICLRTTKTQNSQKVVSYFEYQHLHTPAIYIVQHGNKTIAPEHNSAPLGIVKYHFISNQSSECSERTTTNWSQTATYITASDAGSHVCLRLQDGPITVYRSYQLKTAEVATISTSTTKTITITYPTVSSPKTLEEKSYFTSSSEPACDQTTADSSWTTATRQTITLSSQTNGDYTCTSTNVQNETDSYEVIGYSKKRLVVQPTVAFSSQNKSILTFSFTPTNATKRYYTASAGVGNKPVCTDADETEDWTTITGQSLTLHPNTPAGWWVCVKISDGPFSDYEVLKFEKESPQADIVQSDYKFYVSPGSNKTCASDDDDEIVECKYFKSENEIGCLLSADNPSASNKWNAFSEGVLPDTYTANQYICVQLKNDRGYSTYSARKAITMVVIAIYQQTSEGIRVQYQYGSRSLGTTQYYTQAAEPTCDYSTISKRNTTINDSNNWTGVIPNGHWVCISARNYNTSVSHQAWSFLKVQDIE